MIGRCVKSDTCREKLTAKREVNRRSEVKYKPSKITAKPDVAKVTREGQQPAA